jgi:hypothetical protein
MKRCLAVWALFVFASFPSQIRADLIIGVGSTTLSPGGTGSVDVTIGSTTGADILDIFGVEYRISTLGATQVRFVSPQSGGYLTDANYIFFGDSTSALAPPGSAISTVTYTSDTYVGGDGTVSMAGVTVPLVPTSKLLTRLELTAATGAFTPSDGDVFTIDLIPVPNTFFFDPGFNPVLFTATPGAVTILGPGSAVPEPSTLVMSVLGVMSIGVFRVAKRRKHRVTACARTLITRPE